MHAYHGGLGPSNELPLHSFDSIHVTSEIDGLLELRTGAGTYVYQSGLTYSPVSRYLLYSSP